MAAFDLLSMQITTLMQSGWTEAEIATAVGCTQPTINRIKQGAGRKAMQRGLSILALKAKPSNPQKRSAG